VRDDWEASKWLLVGPATISRIIPQLKIKRHWRNFLNQLSPLFQPFSIVKNVVAIGGMEWPEIAGDRNRTADELALWLLPQPNGIPEKFPSKSEF
jgi:hypothetical protein